MGKVESGKLEWWEGAGKQALSVSWLGVSWLGDKKSYKKDSSLTLRVTNFLSFGAQ